MMPFLTFNELHYMHMFCLDAYTWDKEFANLMRDGSLPLTACLPSMHETPGLIPQHPTNNASFPSKHCRTVGRELFQELEFELRTWSLLGRRSTTGATPQPSIFLLT
jgi:hypothetical protein